MSYISKKYPGFSWSVSRERIFEECLRKYYYHYYLYHKGWQYKSNDINRLAYRLKKLTNIYFIIGTEIHDLINNALKADGYISVNQSINQTYSKLKQAYDQSTTIMLNQKERNKWCRRSKEYHMLREIYYKEYASFREVEEKIGDRIENCIRHIPTTNTFRELKNKLFEIIEIDENFTSFLYNEIVIYAIPDLIYKNKEDEIVIVDWKTGKFDPNKDKEQLYVYACYYWSKYKENRPIIGRVEYLKEGKTYEIMIYPEERVSILNRIRVSINDMKGYISDINQNKPLRKSNFLQTQGYKCTNCNYQKLCTL